MLYFFIVDFCLNSEGVNIMSRKKRVILSVLLSAVMLLGSVACNKTEPAPTTDAPATTTAEATTEAPTTEPAVPAVAAGTKLFGIDLGGMTADDVAAAITEKVEEYVVNVELDGTKFDIYGTALDVQLNPDYDLKAMAEKLISGEITVKDIDPAEIITVGDADHIEDAMLAAYETKLIALLADSKKTEEAMKSSQAASSGSSSEMTSSAAEETTAEEAADETAEAETTAAAEETEPEEEIVLTEEEIAEIEKKISGLVNPTHARITYSKDAGHFVGVDGKPGSALDYTFATKILTGVISRLGNEAVVYSKTVESEGEKADGNDEIAAAIANANEYLNLSITYNFNIPEGSSDSVTISKDRIADFIFVGSNGRDIQIDTDDLSIYASDLSSKYSKTTSTSTRGGENNLTVTTVTTGWRVSSTSIYNNLYNSIKNKSSNTYNAEYTQVNETSTKTEKASTYVLIDLSAQHVYLYQNGVVTVDGPCVSGKVYTGDGDKNHHTPTGTYYIYSMDRNRYLQGNNADGSRYRSYVNYFMPFNGGIGMHDASWRSSFGGTNYILNGSHGCINMPYDVVKEIFSRVSVGTKVVVTGGVRTWNGDSNTVSGSTEYTVKVGESVTMNITSKDNSGNKTVKITSGSDKISLSGMTITGLKPGDATINYHTDVTTTCWAKDTTITVHVQDVPDTTAPTITLKGDANMTIETGKTFTDPGYTAADNKDGDLTSKVTVSGKVDTAKAGTYTLKYNVTDAAGNKAAEATRTVKVVDHVHSWSDWKETKKATCTEAGEKTRTCSTCNKTETEKIDALGHKWGDWTEDQKATCTATGEKTRTCSVCGETETATIDALGHSWSDWTVVEGKEATCITPGEKIRTCSVCGETETATIDALGHSWGEWTEVTPATCTESGTKTRTCDTCGETETATIDALDHDWGDWTVTKEPAVGIPGEEQRVCGHDSSHVETREIPALTESTESSEGGSNEGGDTGAQP